MTAIDLSKRTGDASVAVVTHRLDSASSDNEIVQLRQEAWAARDAVIGTTAELGTARARIIELEATVKQLQIEVTLLQAELRSRPVRAALRLVQPVRAAKRRLP